jgi:hypothetical protein
MRQLGLRGLPTRRLPRGAKLRAVTSQDLVRREFKRKAPNELWLTDITEHPTREGKVYCCAVLDTFSRKIVGWSIDSTQTTSLVLNALGMATQRRPGRDGLVMHSDRGVQLGLNRSSQQPWFSVIDDSFFIRWCGCPVLERQRRPRKGPYTEGPVTLVRSSRSRCRGVLVGREPAGCSRVRVASDQLGGVAAAVERRYSSSASAGVLVKAGRELTL